MDGDSGSLGGFLECPHCGCIGKHGVEQTNQSKVRGAIGRRRSCENCGENFFTRETVVPIRRGHRMKKGRAK